MLKECNILKECNCKSKYDTTTAFTFIGVVKAIVEDDDKDFTTSKKLKKIEALIKEYENLEE